MKNKKSLFYVTLFLEPMTLKLTWFTMFFLVIVLVII